jgi:hypothetical protein
MSDDDERMEEIERISLRALGMASEVHRDASHRETLSVEAERLKGRLLTLADELEAADPAASRRFMHWVSEALLDLNYVMRDTDTVSLRLGDLMRP